MSSDSFRASEVRVYAALLVGLVLEGLSGLALAQEASSADSAMLTVGTGFLPAFVTAGAIDPNGKVPAFNAVPGAGVANLAVAIPVTLLTHGDSYCITVALQDNNVTGDYEVDYYIRQLVGGVMKTILEQKIVTGKTAAPGDAYVWAITSKAIPDSPGIATLVGRVRWGAGYTTEATVTSTILIE
jgi:hypothetical protein